MGSPGGHRAARLGSPRPGAALAPGAGPRNSQQEVPALAPGLLVVGSYPDHKLIVVGAAHVATCVAHGVPQGIPFSATSIIPEGLNMALYLTRFSYTPETWARLSQQPEDRRDAARTYIEAVGGKLHGFWYAFGEYDAYNLWEAPDNVSMAAVALAISGGGALSKYETTVLLTVEETMDAMQRAQEIRYRPPGA